MKRFALVLAAFAALALTPSAQAAVAKIPLEALIQTCMGINGAKPLQQVDACTAAIKSGKLKKQQLPDFYATRGAAYMASGNVPKALADLNTALGMAPNGAAFFQRGMIYIAQNKADLAKADFTKAIQLKPDFGPSYMFRGILLFRSGDMLAAIADFTGALARTQKYPEALYARGVARKKSGDEGGDTDIADAKAQKAGVDQEMAKFGIVP